MFIAGILYEKSNVVGLKEKTSEVWQVIPHVRFGERMGIGLVHQALKAHFLFK